MTHAHDFDIDTFLARPLVARVATNGPAVRPVWFLWEEDAIWWVTGNWAQLDEIVQEDPRAALTIDTCDLETGEVRQVIARGEIEIRPYDRDRAIRKLRRYLGTNINDWDERFDPGAMEDSRFARLVPDALTARDLSFRPSLGDQQD